MRWLVVAVVLSGCAPIPVNKTFVMWPKKTIRVVDADTGKPVEGASIRLVRYQYPHHREDEVKKVTAGAMGEVTIERETKSLRTFPLMMHGVPGFSYEACAEAPGHAAAEIVLRDDDDATVTLKLPLGSRPCRGREPDNTPPPDHKLRVEGVEKDGARWIVSLAMEPGNKVKKGDTLGAFTIDEVLFQSEGSPVIRRARVAVSGDASALRHGNLLAGP